MSLSFPSAGIYPIRSGADPLVRAGPPGPALLPANHANANEQADRASAADQGVRTISVNLIKDIAQPYSAGLCQLPYNLIPVLKGFGQTVRGRNCRTNLVKHKFNLPPSAAPHGPVDIPRGKTCRSLPPCVRPIGWRRFCHAATPAHWPGPSSADVSTP
jgi:hypothetical protein